jgi:regulator of sigma E protease
VKIAGMVDESMDKEQMALPPQPWEYRSKKAYERLFIMLGGIIMNVLVAIGIYAFIFGVWGEEYLPTQNAKYGIMVDSTAKSIGFQNGDQIIAVDGKFIPKFSRIMPEFIVNDASSFTVLRNAQPVTINIPDGTIRKIIKNESRTFIMPRIPIVVADVNKASEAERMGLKAGDSIVGANGARVRFFDEYDEIKRSAAGKPMVLDVMRDGQLVTLKGTVPENKVLGFAYKQYDQFLTLDKVKYGPIQAIGKGFSFTGEQVTNYWKQLKLIFTSKEIKTSESLGGIVSFGKMFSPVFDWQDFLMLTAYLSYSQ